VTLFISCDARNKPKGSLGNPGIYVGNKLRDIIRNFVNYLDPYISKLDRLFALYCHAALMLPVQPLTV
jgi:hypothetical protein